MIYDKKMVLAIIPARKNSKRLPNKNILPLCGKPMIMWTIEAALKSKYIDRVVVSSDCPKILEIGRKLEVSTVKRPAYLATDTASSIEAIKHCIESIKDVYDYIILLQPTSPLRKSFHIDSAFKMLIKKDADAIISVVETEHSPEWSNKIPQNGSMIGFIKDSIINKRSQDLEKYYKLNGAIFICQRNKLLKQNSFFIDENVFCYIMEKEFSLDIDTIFDFKLAQFFMQL